MAHSQSQSPLYQAVPSAGFVRSHCDFHRVPRPHTNQTFTSSSDLFPTSQGHEPPFSSSGTRRPAPKRQLLPSSRSSRQIAPDASLRGRRSMSHTGSDQPAKRQSKWSPEEDALIIKLRGNGMKWDDISKELPGRSAISCRLHYQNYLERRSEWTEDMKNTLAQLYEGYKKEMWAKVAEGLAVPWRAAEAMHWQLGEQDMARRAGVTPFPLAAVNAETNATGRRNSPFYNELARETREMDKPPHAALDCRFQQPTSSRLRPEMVGPHSGIPPDATYPPMPNFPPLNTGQPSIGYLPSIAQLTTGVPPSCTGARLPPPPPPRIFALFGRSLISLETSGDPEASPLMQAPL